MKLLIFDTETTGLPRIGIPPNVEPNNWPHIVSISWVILNTVTNQIEKHRNYIIKPIDWIIPEDSIAIHKITNEKANKEGVDLKFVMKEFLSEKYDTLVAHNLDFDINVIYNAIIWDLNVREFQKIDKPMICTMKASKDICKIKGKFDSYKNPKLNELYEYTFKRQPNSNMLHSSSYDTLILAEVIQHCNELRLKMNLSSNISYYQKNDNSKNETGKLSIDLR